MRISTGFAVGLFVGGSIYICNYVSTWNPMFLCGATAHIGAALFIVWAKIRRERG